MAELTVLDQKISYFKIEDEDYIIQKYLQDISDIETLKNFLKIENVDECKNEILYAV